MITGAKTLGGVVGANALATTGAIVGDAIGTVAGTEFVAVKKYWV